ncbi:MULTISPECIES: ABC transporter permease [unclassified Chelatococcus]|uniref:ABC transporter permease n=1 Tax=unclassified Chelatococcus TaxID=2638111 RepID=UPI001BCC21E5|nr:MULTISPECIES: ABC transporter permease [unclassified Chelatococcus]CAH1657258.1 glycine betaine ABC transporter membrane subunit YehW [Hyphomicrobiales bacterium]MBS7742336.1 ABC transporter permease [Chelatococcus sp. HY11]MBX3542546.1 ABC transporter permease [Chelatococcus sp.]MCO5075237.1 ABC transporter permease [Chelatococcus sp.]CAH1689020.1 glycine betaine ABC transporter membrane subunit YehW [Hyphomicrobiales bacterium]
MKNPGLLGRALVLVLLLAFILSPNSFAPLFRPLTENNAPPIYNHGSLLSLTLSHLTIVFVATCASTLLAVGLGILVTRPSGMEFLPLSRSLVNVGQTFPPVAVLAIAVPLVGFGEIPTFIALFLYGLLPIFENTLTGLAQVPALTREAARGMGMSPRHRLIQVELPLALPVILAGIRISTIINLGTATLGSTVAAKGLGEVIIAGLQSNNQAFVLQGGIIVAMLAVLIDGLLIGVERFTSSRLGGQSASRALR